MTSTQFESLFFTTGIIIIIIIIIMIIIIISNICSLTTCVCVGRGFSDNLNWTKEPFLLGTIKLSNDKIIKVRNRCFLSWSNNCKAGNLTRGQLFRA